MDDCEASFSETHFSKMSGSNFCEARRLSSGYDGLYDYDERQHHGVCLRPSIMSCNQSDLPPDAEQRYITPRSPDFTSDERRLFSNTAQSALYDDCCFGVELEVFLTKYDEEVDNLQDKICGFVVPFLTAAFAGELYPFRFHTRRNSKADTVFDIWKVTNDGSISSEGNIFGFEVISPKLRSWDGFERVARVASVLQQMNCKTNTSTGLHVHVSCKHYNGAQLQSLFMHLLYFERVVDGYHYLSRRGDSGRFCRSIVHSVCHMGDVARAMQQLSWLDMSLDRGVDQAVCLLNPLLDPASAKSGRYHNVNLTLLSGTTKGDEGRRIEFRQHGGSVDTSEIVMWTRFCCRFTSAAAAAPPPPMHGNATAEELWRLVADDTLQSYYANKTFDTENCSIGPSVWSTRFPGK